MTPKQTGTFMFWASLILLLVFVVVAQFSATANVGSVGSAAALGIITSSAVGIERVIETFWTFIGLTRNTWWPLNTISSQVDNLVAGLNTPLEAFYTKAQKAVEAAAEAQQWTDEQIENAVKEIENIKSGINQLRSLASDNQQVQLIAASAFQGISYLEKKYPELREAGTIAQQAITGVSDFVATFKDNPGRRLISIYLGSFLGLIVSGVLGLDLFQAALETSGNTGITLFASETSKGITLFAHLGVAATGLLMGLGSNPVHEAIRTLQEIKKSRRSDNNPVPDAGGGTPAAASGSAPQGVMPQGVMPQGVMPQGVMPQGVMPQGAVAATDHLKTFSLRQPRS